MQRFSTIAMIFVMLACSQSKMGRHVALRLKRNLEFAVDGKIHKVCGSQVFAVSGRGDYLCYVNATKKQFELRAINATADQIVPLQLFDSLYGLNDLKNFYVEGEDSFFFFLPDRKIILLDERGVTRQEWQLRDSLPVVGKDYEISGGFPYPPILMNNRFYLLIYPTNLDPWKKADQHDYYSCPAEIVFDPGQNKIIAQVGHYPAEFFRGNYFYEYGPSKCAGRNSTIVYSFSTNDSVFRYDAAFRKTTFPLAAEGMKRQQPFPPDSLYNPYYIRNYFTEQPCYKHIIYNSEHGLFFRAALGDTTSENEDGSFNNHKPFRIIIADSAFQKIGEQRMDCATYAHGIFCSTPSGIYISRYSERKTGKPDVIRLSLFEIIEQTK